MDDPSTTGPGPGVPIPVPEPPGPDLIPEREPGPEPQPPDVRPSPDPQIPPDPGPPEPPQTNVVKLSVEAPRTRTEETRKANNVWLWSVVVGVLALLLALGLVLR
jgi:kexin